MKVGIKLMSIIKGETSTERALSFLFLNQLKRRSPYIWTVYVLYECTSARALNEIMFSSKNKQQEI